MKQEQFERLQALSEKLTEVFLEEADPDSWPGAGAKIADMTKEQRGDRYWSKKNAAATITLMQRIHTLTDVIRAKTVDETDRAGVADPEVDVDKEIAAAEREAERLLDVVNRSARKATFDNKVHGKR